MVVRSQSKVTIVEGSAMQGGYTLISLSVPIIMTGKKCATPSLRRVRREPLLES